MTAALPVVLNVNGLKYEFEVLPNRSLLDVLRDELGLTGTKECCAVGECGACTVHFDGRSINACLMLAIEADGGKVTTIEGIAPPGEMTRVQDAFLEHGAVQCGFCIPGMVMSAEYLLARIPHPTEEEIREGLSGNLCRCGGYNRMLRAISSASEESTR